MNAHEFAAKRATKLAKCLKTSGGTLTAKEVWDMKNAYDYFTRDSMGFTDYKSSVEKGQKNKMKLSAMDESLAGVIAVMDKVYPLAKDISAYLGTKEYLDDDFAKIKKILPDLEQYHQDMEKYQSVFAAVDEAIVAATEDRNIALIEKEYGKNYYWQHVTTMKAARNAVNIFDEASPDLDVFSERFALL